MRFVPPHSKTAFHSPSKLAVWIHSGRCRGQKRIHETARGGCGGATRRVLDKQPVTGDQLCLRMGDEQRPQVGVPRIGGIAAGDRLAPDGVGDQVGIELMEGFPAGPRLPSVPGVSGLPNKWSGEAWHGLRFNDCHNVAPVHHTDNSFSLGVDTHRRGGILSLDQQVACPNGRRTTPVEGVCTTCTMVLVPASLE